uniref:Catenin alpha-2 n=1 Tax=Spermophilus dauricus TaxID=99837 RepID=A0A8C9PBN1_SPEDA
MPTSCKIHVLPTQELKDPHCRDEMAAARGALKKNATMLYTASQAFLRHPDVAATRANRDYVFKQVQEAIAGISNAAQATSPTDEAKGHTGIGELANKIILDPMTFSEARFRPSLEERLESIISGAALMADSSCTRDDRRERIVAECNAVRQALQDLLSEYMNNVSPGVSGSSRLRGFPSAISWLLGKACVAPPKRTGVPGRVSGDTNQRSSLGDR